jgi:hypothetical protein
LDISTDYSRINLADSKHNLKKKRSKRQPKRFKLKYFFTWLGKEPLKFIAYICAVVFIYVTFLFIQFARDQHKNDHNANAIERSGISNKSE